MRLSNKTDYAIRSAIELAYRFGMGPVKTEEIATAQNIPARYLGAILNDLRKGGLVAATRGPEGGYQLAKLPSQISLADVIRAIDGALTQVGGMRPETLHYQGSSKGLEEVWVAIRAAERAILQSVSLESLVTSNLPIEVMDLLRDPQVWK